jgi:hypothetical protein
MNLKAFALVACFALAAGQQYADLTPMQVRLFIFLVSLKTHCFHLDQGKPAGPAQTTEFCVAAHDSRRGWVEGARTAARDQRDPSVSRPVFMPERSTEPSELVTLAGTVDHWHCCRLVVVCGQRHRGAVLGTTRGAQSTKLPKPKVGPAPRVSLALPSGQARFRALTMAQCLSTSVRLTLCLGVPEPQSLGER